MSGSTCAGRIEDALPEGLFDLVVAALVVHHLRGREKAGLFGRVRSLLRPGGRLVVADVVVPEHREDALTPLSSEYDHPSSVADQLTWLERVGLAPTVTSSRRDLVVIAAGRHPQEPADG